jgi:hypothetical protein
MPNRVLVLDADIAGDRPLLYSIPNTRKALGDLGNTKAYELIAEGKLIAVKLGGRTFVTADSLDALVASLPRADIRTGQSRDNAAADTVNASRRRRRRPKATASATGPKPSELSVL